MKSYQKIVKVVTATIFILFSTSNWCCKKFIEVEAPSTSINQENVFTNDSYAISAITGIYAKMSTTGISLKLSVYPELSADNLSLFDLNNTDAILFYQNQLNSSSGVTFWADLYAYIYSTNAAIEGLSKATALTGNVQKRLLGEAYFLRGFFYFYLANFYNNVPLVLTTDYSKSSSLGVSSSDAIYAQIVQDLTESKKLLDNSFLDGTLLKTTVERVRPNAMSATALLARVYLYTKNYPKAEEEATTLIDHNELFTLTDINNVFIKNSNETIWSLQAVGDYYNTAEGYFFNYSDAGPDPFSYTYLPDDLIDQFEKGDLRKDFWINTFQKQNISYPHPYKYKVKEGDAASATEYSIVFRLAEQYLIRAEARIRQGNILGGIDDLNKIRKRARAQITPDMPNPLPDVISTISEETAIDAVLRERRTELFAEWGNRWFDLRRTGKIDDVMTLALPLKRQGGVWKNYMALYPIPQNEINQSPGLKGKQNPGY